MDKIFTSLRAWLQSLLAVDTPPDALSSLDPAQLADIPPLHPRRND